MDSRGRDGDGGNRENEQGGASSSQSARPFFPPPRPPGPPRRAPPPPPPPPMALPPPANFPFDCDYHYYIIGNLPLQERLKLEMDRRGRDGDGGNRENEQGGASSSQSARPSFPPPSPPRRAPPPPAPPPMALPPPANFPFDCDYHYYIIGNLQPSPAVPLHSVQRDSPAAREVQQQMQGALQPTERNPADNSQQISSVRSDSSPTAREKPVRNLPQELEASNSRKRRRTSYTGDSSHTQQGTSSECTEGKSDDGMDLE